MHKPINFCQHSDNHEPAKWEVSSGNTPWIKGEADSSPCVPSSVFFSVFLCWHPLSFSLQKNAKTWCNLLLELSCPNTTPLLKLNQVMISQCDVTGTFLSCPTVRFSFPPVSPIRFLLILYTEQKQRIQLLHYYTLNKRTHSTGKDGIF